MSNTNAEVNLLSDRLRAYGYSTADTEILLGEDIANLTYIGTGIAVPWVASTDSIDVLADVDTTTAAPVAGEVLQWDGTNWTPAALAGALLFNDTATIDLTNTGGTITADFIGDSDDVPEGATNLYHTDARVDARIGLANIQDLANVTSAAAPTAGDTLTWDGTSWVNQSPVTAPVATVADGDTIDFTLAANDLTAEVIVDPSTANILTASDTGLLASLASIDGHTDVDTSTTAPTSGQALIWDGTNFTPQTITTPGEYSGGFDVAGGAFPAVDGIDGSAVNSQDWFNATAAGTLDGVTFGVGDRLIAVVDNPSTTTFAGNWAVISSPAAPISSVNGQTGVVNLGIDDLSDVDTSTAAPTVGQVLSWDGTNWVPGVDANFVKSVSDTATIDLTVDAAGDLTGTFVGDSDDVPEGTANLYFTDARTDARIALANIEDLANVTSAAAPTNGDVLQWNGTSWVNAALPAGFITARANTDSINLTNTAGTLTADLNVDPAPGNLLSVSAAGALVTETAAVVTTDGDATGVAQSGTASHTVDITLLSTDVDNAIVTGTDGGVLYVAPETGQVFQDVAVSTTFATTMQSKIAASAVAVRGGQYKVTVSYLWNHDGTGNDFESELLVNGAAVTAFGSGLLHKQEPRDAAGNTSATGSSQAFGFTHVFVQTFAAGATPTFALNYRTDTATNESSIWDATIILEAI